MSLMKDELAGDKQAPIEDNVAFGADEGQSDDTDDAHPHPPARNVVDLDSEGPLLALTDEAAAKYLLKLWEHQDHALHHRLARWKANHLRRIGVPGVRLVRTNYDKLEFTLWAPPGGSRTPPAMNKAARLCRRVADNIFSDPPVPEAEPASDSDEERAAAEFMTRVLTNEGSESGTNNLRSITSAFSKASTFGSGFRYHWVDPKGGGHRSREVLASKNATEMGDGEETPLLDPTTGLPDPNPILRYVSEDGKTLTDDPRKAQLTWSEKLRHTVLTGKQVRFLPPDVEGIGDADGVLIAQFIPWARLRSLYPDAVAEMSPSEIKAMAKYRPERYHDLLPDWKHEVHSGTKVPKGGTRDANRGTKAPDGETDDDADETTEGAEKGDEQGTRAPDPAMEALPDDADVFTLRGYYRAGPSYPMGCCMVLAGDKAVLHREQWIGENTDGETEPLDIPVDQVRQLQEGEDDPYGYGLMDVLGPINEIINAQYGAWLEHLERFNNRKWFLPISSIVQAKQMQQATGTYIAINAGGQPIAEEIPAYPTDSVNLLDRCNNEANDESGLQEAAQGLEVSSIKSGVQANYTVEQANKALSEMHANVVDALVRGWRIDAQLIRANYSTPRKLRMEGDDSSYKEREWNRSDLGSARDVRLQEGSFTMQTPSQKATVATQYAQQGVLSQDQYKAVVRAQIQPLLAVQDDPHLLRVQRQIANWKDGPSDQLKQAAQRFQAMQALQPPAPPMPAAPAPGAPGGPIAAIGPQGRVPMAPPAAPPQPPPNPLQQAAAQLFVRLPIDLEPLVAVVRHNELARTMAGNEFAKQGPEWQQSYQAEYEAMRAAAGLMTIQEQSQSQQTQAAQAVTLKEIPQIVAKANVDSTTVAQFEEAVKQGYQPGAQPAPAAPAPGGPAPAMGGAPGAAPRPAGPPMAPPHPGPPPLAAVNQ